MQEFLSECFKRDIQVILASGDEYVKNPNVDKDTPLEDIQFHESTACAYYSVVFRVEHRISPHERIFQVYSALI